MTTLQHVSGPETNPTGSAHFTARVSRAEAREQLSNAQFDLLVIGGGILGISTAWHAAQSGLRVALVDAGDFAGATSSASSKLLHGG
ncbi:MAG TPA: FAD-dependent oxidoreductase, partial [Glycomyces sp.]